MKTRNPVAKNNKHRSWRHDDKKKRRKTEGDPIDWQEMEAIDPYLARFQPRRNSRP